MGWRVLPTNRAVYFILRNKKPKKLVFSQALGEILTSHNDNRYLQVLQLYRNLWVNHLLCSCQNPERTLTERHLRFSYFEFKIRLIHLIRWQKNNVILKKTFLRFDPRIYWSPVRHATHYTKLSTVSERHRKACNRLQSCLTGSSWIHLIHLIQLI